jgi:GGDEF domain-containing protein
VHGPGRERDVALLSGASKAQTHEVTQRLGQLLKLRNAELLRGYQIRFGVGQVSYEPEHHRTIAEWLAAADAAMYSHKQASKARSAQRH